MKTALDSYVWFAKFMFVPTYLLFVVREIGINLRVPTRFILFKYCTYRLYHHVRHCQLYIL